MTRTAILGAWLALVLVGSVAGAELPISVRVAAGAVVVIVDRSQVRRCEHRGWIVEQDGEPPIRAVELFYVTGTRELLVVPEDLSRFHCAGFEDSNAPPATSPSPVPPIP